MSTDCAKAAVIAARQSRQSMVEAMAQACAVLLQPGTPPTERPRIVLTRR